VERRQGLIEAPFQHVQFFGFFFEAAALTDLRFRVVLGNEEVQFLGHRTGAHVSLEHLLHVVNAVTGLLFGFVTDSLLRCRTFQQTCRHFDQQAVVAVDEYRQTELAGQHHRALFAVEQQDRRSIAPVVDFARLPLPVAVVAQVVKGDLLQQVPVVGQHLSVDDVDPLGCLDHDA